MKTINVLLAGNFPVFRQGLQALLEAEADIVVVGEAQNGRAAVELTKKLFPDAVIMDVAVPGPEDVESARQILEEAPGTRVLALSRHSDDPYFHQLKEAGVTGCLLSQTSGADLIKAVRATMSGSAFSPAISNRLGRQYQPAFLSARPVRRLMSMLTTRELEVWQLIAEGQASKQIAFDLFISVKTVEKHRQNLMNKLNIHHVAGLTRYAIAEGIIKAVPEGRSSLVPWAAPAIAR